MSAASGPERLNVGHFARNANCGKPMRRQTLSHH